MSRAENPKLTAASGGMGGMVWFQLSQGLRMACKRWGCYGAKLACSPDAGADRQERFAQPALQAGGASPADLARLEQSSTAR